MKLVAIICGACPYVISRLVWEKSYQAPFALFSPIGPSPRVIRHFIVRPLIQTFPSFFCEQSGPSYPLYPLWRRCTFYFSRWKQITAVIDSWNIIIPFVSLSSIRKCFFPTNYALIIIELFLIRSSEYILYILIKWWIIVMLCSER